MRIRFLLFIVFFSHPFVQACDCIPKTIEEAYESSDMIVKGSVLTINRVERKVSDAYVDSFQKLRDQLFFRDAGMIEYKILVLKRYKGFTSGDTIKVRTFAPSNCHLQLDTGKIYIVYVKNIRYLQTLNDLTIDANTFQSTRCSRTSEYSLNEEQALEKFYLRDDTLSFQKRNKDKYFHLPVNNFYRVDEVKIKDYGWYAVVIGDLSDSTLTLYFHDTTITHSQKDSLGRRYRKSTDSLNLVLYTRPIQIPINQIDFIYITDYTAGKRKVLNRILGLSILSPVVLWIAGANPIISMTPIGVAYLIHLKLNYKYLDLENKWMIIAE